MRQPIDWQLEVVPADAGIDVPRRITVSGLRPGATVHLRTQTARGPAGTLWRSAIEARADDHGVLDLTRDAPVSGTYDGVAAMGLIWSQAPDVEGDRDHLPADARDDVVTELTAEVDGVQRTATLRQRLAAPGVTRREVRERGLVGTLYTPAGPGPHPAVVILNGSGGGANEPRAALYASHGFAAFALAYFKAPGLSDYISNTPLEYFEAGLQWVRDVVQPADDFIALSGQSRGGELVLLLATRFPAWVSAVVAYVPGAVVHGGQNAADPAVGRDGPAWLHRGQPIPYVWQDNRTASWAPWDDGPAPRRHANAVLTALDDPQAVARARIPVEAIRGPVILLSGTDDGSWPSSRYSRMVTNALAAAGHPHPVHHIDVEGAGHAILFPYVPTTQLTYRHPVSGRTSTGGGTPASNAEADERSWLAVRECLQQAVADHRAARAKESSSVTTATPTPDLVDTVLGTTPGSRLDTLRNERRNVRESTQGALDALLGELPGLALQERLLAAIRASHLAGAADFARHFEARLQALGAEGDAAREALASPTPEDVADPRLRTLLRFVHDLTVDPTAGGKPGLHAVQAAGLTTPDIVALSQLLAFLSYQIRVAAGLRALAALEA